VELRGAYFGERLAPMVLPSVKYSSRKKKKIQIFLMICSEYLVGTHQVSLEKEKKGEATCGISKVEMGISFFEMPLQICMRNPKHDLQIHSYCLVCCVLD